MLAQILCKAQYLTPLAVRPAFNIGRTAAFSRRFNNSAILFKDPLMPSHNPNESLETQRARLLWQSRKRGILETCVILGKFAKEYMPTLTKQEMDDYDELMNENDWDIYYWITNAKNAPKPCPEKFKSQSVFQKLQRVAANPDNETLRQPDL